MVTSLAGHAQDSAEQHVKGLDLEQKGPAASAGGGLMEPCEAILALMPETVGPPQPLEKEEDDGQAQVENASRPKSARSKKSRVCAQCGKSRRDGVTVHACSGCNAVLYCGPDCQHTHWPLHKRDCKSRRSRQGEVAAQEE